MGDIGVLILGAGGHGIVIADALLAAGKTVVGFLDDDPGLSNTRRLGLPVLGGDALLARFASGSVRLANGLGSVGLPGIRRTLYETLVARGYQFETIVHPGAIVSRYAVLGKGVQVMAGAIVQAGATLAENVLVNTHASVDHGCAIGAHCHLAPGSTLSGNVTLGRNCHVGTGAVMIQGVEVGEGSVIGAGAVVVGDHGPHSTLVGVPARMMKNK